MREMPCSYKSKVWVLRRADRRPPLPPGGEHARRDVHALQVQKGRLRRDRQVHRQAKARGELPVRGVQLPRGRLRLPRHALYKHVLDDHEDMVSSVAYLQSRTLSTVTLWLQKSAPFVVFVQVGAKSVLLLLNGGGVPTGRCLSLVYLGHGAEGNAEINYELEVRGSEPGTLSLVATAPCIHQLEGFEAKKFLYVPDAGWGPSGVVSVTVSYW